MGTQTAPAATAVHVLRMTEGLIVHQSLCAAAELGIADLLKDGARATADLAAVLQVNEDALYRTLRFLAGQGVFYETGARIFANSALSQHLRSDVSGSVRSILIYRGSSSYFAPFGDLLRSIRTGSPARNQTPWMKEFAGVRGEPADGSSFDDAMADISKLWAPSIAAGYTFGRWGTLMDVGGGNGMLLAAILREYPALRGVLADQPHVLERARKRGSWPPDVSARVSFQPVDFFEEVPAGCCAYLMKNIIHDWDDEKARRILLNCRRAVPADGVLLLVEYCLEGDNVATVGKALDLAMLTLTGGRERTVGEHRELLASAGFLMQETISLPHDVMILEARPVSRDG